MTPSPSAPACRHLLPLLLLALGTWGAAGPAAQAQEFGRIAEIETNTSYFYYARPGEATIQVSLWGAGQSGIYEIPDSTALDRLLTIAGGAQIGERQENQKPPKITIQVYRAGSSRQGPAFDLQLRNLLRGEAPNPLLQEGDIVVVETIQRTRFTWRDGLSILTTAASLTLLALRILRFRR